MSEFASGRHANAVCDICSVRTEYNDLKLVVRAGIPTNLYACNYCWDKDHPQLFLGRKPIKDPQTLRRARPDPSLAESRQFFDRVKIVQPPVDVEIGELRASTWKAIGGSVTRDATRTAFNGISGDAFVEDTSFGVHGLYKFINIVSNANISWNVNIKAASPGREYFAMRMEDAADATPMYTEVFTPFGTYLGVGSVLGGATMISRVITPLSNGWYNYAVVFNIGSGVTLIRVNLYGRDSGSTGYTGDGRLAFYYMDESSVS